MQSIFPIECSHEHSFNHDLQGERLCSGGEWHFVLYNTQTNLINLQSHIAHSGKDDTEKSSQGQSEEAVFETHEGEMEFKTLHWPMAAIVMTKIQFGLGILSVPAAFASLGGKSSLSNGKSFNFIYSRSWCNYSFSYGRINHLGFYHHL